MMAAIFISLLIIEGCAVWIALDVGSIRKTLLEIKRLLKEGADNA